MDIPKLRSSLNKLSLGEIISIIIETPNKSKSTMFHCLASGGHIEMLDVLSKKDFTSDQWLLLLKGQNLSGQTAIHVAAGSCHSNILSLMLRKVGKEGCYQLVSVPDEHGDTALHVAVRNKNFDAIQRIFAKAYANSLELLMAKNGDLQTAFHLDLVNGNELLTMHRYWNANCWLEIASIQDRIGHTIAHHAATKGQEKLIQRIFRCENENVPSVEECAHHKKLLEIPDVQGNTALHLAALEGDLKVFDCVLRDMNPQLRNELLTKIKNEENKSVTGCVNDDDTQQYIFFLL